MPFFFQNQKIWMMMMQEEEMEIPFRNLVDHYLSLGLFSNAVFHAERLFALSQNGTNLYLLAMCHLRANHHERVYRLLQKELPNVSDSDTKILIQLRYIFAQACLSLNKLREGENILVQNTVLAHQSPLRCKEELLANCNVPNGSTGLYLLGLICEKDNRRDHATAYFSLALKIDPYNWDAYERLCNMGAEFPPEAFFGTDDLSNAESAPLPILIPVANSMHAGQSQYRLQPIVKENTSLFALARVTSIPWPTVAPENIRKSIYLEDENLSTEVATLSRQHYTELEATSENLTGNVVSAVFTDQKGSPKASDDTNRNPDKKKLVNGWLMILALMCKIGRGMRYLSTFRCTEAIQVFNDLPMTQQETGWVLQQRGRAYFEMADYRSARTEFENMRRVAPDRMSGLELYSTNLWHLKDEVELCFLAQGALEQDKKSPEAWCAIGNCFSLQKEHDVAIKFFQRALQIDPSFTYAYTLCGHEFVSNEDFEKAIAYYRHAIRTDPRHYNAWYGLGTIYYRQEKYDLAEYHFKRAISINSRSSVLFCYMGMVLHANHKFNAALEMLQRASELEPSNPQAKFQRALVLRSMNYYEESLRELEIVRDFAPREASVHSLMGKLCKQLDRKSEALLHFTTALDLDPKDSNLMKLAIDRLDSPDIEDGDELG